MRRPDVRKYLADIQRAGQLIGQFTQGKVYSDYREDLMLQSAVERQFEVIGEALGQMLRVFPEMRTGFSDSARIIAFRNLLIHG